jgi:hypothetical protein
MRCLFEALDEDSIESAFEMKVGAQAAVLCDEHFSCAAHDGTR